jgi:hypothetical protein
MIFNSPLAARRPPPALPDERAMFARLPFAPANTRLSIFYRSTSVIESVLHDRDMAETVGAQRHGEGVGEADNDRNGLISEVNGSSSQCTAPIRKVNVATMP